MTPEAISVRMEFTPNPNTLKFVVNRRLIEHGAKNISNPKESGSSPLAQKLFQIPGIEAVLISSDFVTVTKGFTGDWEKIANEVPKIIETHVGSPDWIIEEEPQKKADETYTEVEHRIRAILDNEIRPAVAMDGGDITFGRFEEGVVYLHLQGACSMCPSSVATLKMGVETRLKDSIPEVKEVVQI